MAALELEVVGRHAMLFDDDATLEFVNSKQALIEWNSLFIDRFDVRNLITTAPPSFRHLPSSFHHASAALPADDSHLHPDLDAERFADLAAAAADDEDEGAPIETEVEAKDAEGYRCVPFSYGNSADCTDQKDSNMGLSASAFHPSFPVPENLLQNLPPTDKVHQIIARTAIFVGEHGGQSEIVLRVKQGDNPTFGFLMPNHHLHPYFRYLVDHPEVVKSDNASKSPDGKTNDIQASGSLSLLGSVYGSGEDEDGAVEVDRGPEQMDSGATSAADMLKCDQSEQTSSSGHGIPKEDADSILPQHSKVKATAVSKYGVNSSKPGRAISIKNDGKVSSTIDPIIEKPKTSSLFPVPQVETSFAEPPSELKRMIDRIVEIVLKNGKDFEGILIEQDKQRGKFPFLLPSNQYNPYYLRVLMKAQESRINGKTTYPEKDSSSWQEMEKNPARQVKESGLASPDASDDLLFDYDKKEKFKMVIPKSRKDSQDQPSKESQPQCGFTVDTAAAAAILQAATRGIRKPNLDIFSKISDGSSKEGGRTGSTSLHSAQSQGLKESGESSDTVPGAKPIAKLSTYATASEVDSSKAGLTRQQKLKAERLRRAKMFAAMIKSGVGPSGTEPLRATSLDPSGSGNSGTVTENVTEEVRGREDSSVPVKAGMSNEEMVKSIQDLSNDENEQKLSKRRHYRSRKHDEGEGEEGKEGNGKGSEEEEEEEDEEDKRRSRKRHRSRHFSSHHRDRSKDRHKHRRKHSSSKSKESHHRHKHDDSSSLEDDDDRHHRQKHNSSTEEERKHRKRSHRHDRSYKEDKEHHKSGYSSSEDESKHYKRRHKQSHRKDRHRDRSRKSDKSHAEEGELEDGEIRTRSSDQSLSAVGNDASREASVDASKSPHEEKRSSLPPAETTEVPDELRAKIRAMLLATM